ncbi:hypothetical protein [Vagococcus silagei]|uniref:DUF308 domain-containing protein n=1 Tax=Vagococcus silagei TaxID=2508885 RepID=A0A4S3B456_9ENTE|nr:hypothetical protein [Vagococcus silagei]THB61924.1 hypothetical protein ESZ54_01575 [Vagococcus silagei]
MAKKFKSYAYYFDQSNWSFHLSGIFLIIFSSFIFASYNFDLSHLVIPVGIVTMLKGFFSFGFYYFSYQLFENTRLKHSFLLLGFINLFSGLLLIFSLFIDEFWVTVLIIACLAIDTIFHFIMMLIMEVLQGELVTYKKIYFLFAFVSIGLISIPTVREFIGPSFLVGSCLFINGMNLFFFRSNKN